MKFTITLSSLLLFLFISFNIQAQDIGDSCLTHGDCHAYAQTVSSYHAIITKTGTDSFGNTTCSRLCYQIELTKYCAKQPNRLLGKCQQEFTPEIPFFNPDDPNACDVAVDRLPLPTIRTHACYEL